MMVKLVGIPHSTLIALIIFKGLGLIQDYRKEIIINRLLCLLMTILC
jgi:hypothetical protein